MRRCSCVLWVVLCLALPGVSSALSVDLLPEWSVSGSNTVRGDGYGGNGDGSASPWQDSGLQAYDELSLTLQRRLSPWNRLRANIDGVLNDSSYRSDHQGIVPERLNIGWENGETGIPFRLEAGDTFGFFSYRLLQRSLKGVQLDLQPRRGDGKGRSSWLLLLGTRQPDWREIGVNNDNLTVGLSWVREEDWGRFSFNLVNNHRRADSAAGLLARDQRSGSLAFDVPFQTDGWKTGAEGEFALFSGDHDGANGNNGQDREDSALYLQLRGSNRNLPFRYRLRFERNGENFRPAGGVAIPDRRAVEAHAEYRMNWGATLRGRMQSYRDAMASGNPQRTRVIGLNYSGSLLAQHDPQLSGGLDLYRQSRSDSNGSLDSETHSLNLNLSRPLAGGWVGDLSLGLVRIRQTSTDITRNLRLAANHTLVLGGWKGMVRPGVSLVSDTGRSGFQQVAPRLALQLQRGLHRLDANIDLSRQEARSASAINTLQSTVALRHEYRLSPLDRISSEFNLFARDPEPGRSTGAWQLGIAWRHAFERPARTGAERRRTPVALGSSADRFGLLTMLAPGTDAGQALERVIQAGLGAPRRIGNLRVYETPLLDEIDLRQRLVVQLDAGEVAGTALLIDFDPNSSPQAMAASFERVREQMLRRFGRPDADYSRGEFVAGLASALQSGRFLRVMDWRLTNGILRFGIPRRLDGRIRMEARFLPVFGIPYDGLWGLGSLH